MQCVLHILSERIQALKWWPEFIQVPILSQLFCNDGGIKMIEKARRAIEAMSEALDVFDKMELTIEERECTLSYEAATAIIQGFRQLEHEIKRAKKSLAKDHEDIMTIVNGFRQLESERDAAANAMKEFAARINSGEDVSACEYCKKEFGVCNCNCLKEFEFRGAKEGK